jgi:hypothetical protein
MHHGTSWRAEAIRTLGKTGVVDNCEMYLEAQWKVVKSTTPLRGD